MHTIQRRKQDGCDNTTLLYKLSYCKNSAPLGFGAVTNALMQPSCVKLSHYQNMSMGITMHRWTKRLYKNIHMSPKILQSLHWQRDINYILKSGYYYIEENQMFSQANVDCTQRLASLQSITSSILFTSYLLIFYVRLELVLIEVTLS